LVHSSGCADKKNPRKKERCKHLCLELDQTQLNTTNQCPWQLNCQADPYARYPVNSPLQKNPNLWRWNLTLQDLSYNTLNMGVHMKVLQHAQRICNKNTLLGMMLNEEKNSTMAKN